MIRETARIYKIVQERKRMIKNLEIFKKIIDKCIEPGEKCVAIAQPDGKIKWDGFIFSVVANSYNDGTIYRQYKCPECNQYRSVGTGITTREHLLESINTEEGCFACSSPTIEGLIEEIAQQAAYDAMENR